MLTLSSLRSAPLILTAVLGVGLMSAPAVAATDAPMVLAVDTDLFDDVVDDVARFGSPTRQGSTSTTLVLPATHAGVAAQHTHATGSIGLGLQVGSPTAITLKLAPPLSSGLAFGFGAGFGYGRNFNASIWLHADYLFALATLLDVDGLRLGVYAGPGLFATVFGSHYGLGYAGAPYFNSFDAVGFGVRLPMGLAMVFDALPLELYAELDPAVGVFPGIGFGIGGSLGFRYYF